MRTLMKYLAKIATFLGDFGLAGVYSLFFPVGWKQDTLFVNDGADIIVSKHAGYFTGTYRQRNKFLA